jgi:hypothetical protein
MLLGVAAEYAAVVEPLHLGVPPSLHRPPRIEPARILVLFSAVRHVV